MSMRSFEGKKIFNGVAIGKIHFYSKEQNQVVRRKVEDAAAEWARYEEARQTAIEQLLGLYEKAKVEVGEDNAVIFEVHSMMLEDDDYNDSIRNIIENQGVNAEYAVGITGDNFAEMFASMDDEYMKARSADVKDISERVISILSGGDQSTQIGAQPVIVVAEDLAPSETVQMDKSSLLAFVTRLGSSNSHTAILARTMSIPALIGVQIDPEWNGHMGIVDGYAGRFIVDPDEETLEIYREQQR